MEINNIDYQTKQKNISQRKNIPYNFQSFFVLIHFSMFKIYLFTKETLFYLSYQSQFPFLFYSLLFIFSFMLKYHSKACHSPSYAKNEVKSDDLEEPNHNNNQFFCRYCQIYVPLRASHCLICKKCIIRKDHHCPWTNNCIGRDNHLYFFIFTLFALILDIVPFFDALYHLIFNYLKIVKSKGFILIILCYIILMFATSFAACFISNLVYQNFLSIIKNSTLWERKKRDRITYLRDIPSDQSPFDKGIVKNIIEFCTMRQKKMKWELN